MNFIRFTHLQKIYIEAITDKDKANMLASQFEEVHNIDLLNNTCEQTTIIKEVNEFLQNTNINSDWTKYMTSPKEIFNEIRKLPSRKAPGIDRIQNIILKNLNHKAIVQITYIINACLNFHTSHNMENWKSCAHSQTWKKQKRTK